MSKHSTGANHAKSGSGDILPPIFEKSSLSKDQLAPFIYKVWCDARLGAEGIKAGMEVQGYTVNDQERTMRFNIDSGKGGVISLPQMELPTAVRYLFDRIDKNGTIGSFKKVAAELRKMAESLADKVAENSNDQVHLSAFAEDLIDIFGMLSVIPLLAFMAGEKVTSDHSISVEAVMDIFLRPITEEYYRKLKEGLEYRLYTSAVYYVPTVVDLPFMGLTIPEEVFSPVVAKLCMEAVVRGEKSTASLRGLLEEYSRRVTDFMWANKADLDMAQVYKAALRAADPKTKARMDAFPSNPSRLLETCCLVIPEESEEEQEAAEEVAEEAAEEADEDEDEDEEVYFDPRGVEYATSSARMVKPGLAVTPLNRKASMSKSSEIKDFFINGPAMVRWMVNSYTTAIHTAAARAKSPLLWPHKSSVTRSAAEDPSFVKRA